MFKIIAAAAFVFVTTSSAVYAGNCQHSWDSASDGSRCGGRAADQRPGGN